jgi:hypothetical protein
VETALKLHFADLALSTKAMNTHFGLTNNPPCSNMALRRHLRQAEYTQFRPVTYLKSSYFNL